MLRSLRVLRFSSGTDVRTTKMHRSEFAPTLNARVLRFTLLIRFYTARNGFPAGTAFVASCNRGYPQTRFFEFSTFSSKSGRPVWDKRVFLVEKNTHMYIERGRKGKGKNMASRFPIWLAAGNAIGLFFKKRARC